MLRFCPPWSLRWVRRVRSIFLLLARQGCLTFLPVHASTESPSQTWVSVFFVLILCPIWVKSTFSWHPFHYSPPRPPQPSLIAVGVPQQSPSTRWTTPLYCARCQRLSWSHGRLGLRKCSSPYCLRSSEIVNSFVSGWSLIYQVYLLYFS